MKGNRSPITHIQNVPTASTVAVITDQDIQL